MQDSTNITILKNLDEGLGISPNLIFYNNFSKIPNVINCKYVNLEIVEKLSEIGFVKSYEYEYIRGYDELTDKLEFRKILIHPILNIVIQLQAENLSNGFSDSFQLLLYHNPIISKIDDVLNIIKENFVYETFNDDNKVYLIKRTRNGLSTAMLELSHQKIDVENYYNKDFQPIYEKLIDSLSKQNSKGLVLLHGIMGSGKSSLIKHLTKVIKNKKFIFIPAYMSNTLVNPDFTDFIMEHKNSILILEDAESILMSRGSSNMDNQAVSNILNITDGILADGLGIQVIATFNTDLKNLDEALLRKGRLIAKYEFKELETDLCNKIFEDNDVEFRTNVPMTLADVFNIDDKIGQVEKVVKSQIGFKK